jgi:hypothetical protein
MTEVKTGTAYYQLGNCLRGYFYGDFASDQDAWEKLGDAFNRAWPSRSGRSVEMPFALFAIGSLCFLVGNIILWCKA